MAKEPFSKSAKKSSRDAVPDGYVAVGRISGPFGVRGEIKLEPLAPPQTFQPGRTVTLRDAVHTIEGSRRHKGAVLLKLSAIDAPETVREFQGEYILSPEADLTALEEGEYYRYQLIGLRVVSTEGEELGEVTEVLERPANDVFIVRGPRGEILVPASEEIVQSIDIEASVMTIEVVPGLLR